MILYLYSSNNFHGIWAFRKTLILKMSSQCQQESAIYSCWNIKHLLCSFSLLVLSFYQIKKKRVFKHSHQVLWQYVSVQKTIFMSCLFLSYSCFTKRTPQNFFLKYLLSHRIGISYVAWEIALGKAKSHLIWYKNVDIENYTGISSEF